MTSNDTMLTLIRDADRIWRHCTQSRTDLEAMAAILFNQTHPDEWCSGVIRLNHAQDAARTAANAWTAHALTMYRALSARPAGDTCDLRDMAAQIGIDAIAWVTDPYALRHLPSESIKGVIDDLNERVRACR